MAARLLFHIFALVEGLRVSTPEEEKPQKHTRHKVDMRVYNTSGKKILFGCTTSLDAHVAALADAHELDEEEGSFSMVMVFDEDDGAWNCTTRLDMSDETVEYSDADMSDYLCEVHYGADEGVLNKKGDKCDIRELELELDAPDSPVPEVKIKHKAILKATNAPIDEVLCSCYVGGKLVGEKRLSNVEEGEWHSAEILFESGQDEAWSCLTQLVTEGEDYDEVDPEPFDCLESGPDTAQTRKGVYCEIVVTSVDPSVP